MTNGNIWVFPIRLVCKAGWGFEGLSSLLLINNRVINQRGWDCDTETQTHKGTEWRLNMEPDTVSPYSSVISTVCVALFITCGGEGGRSVWVRVCLCVFLYNLCVPVCKSQLESICTLSCLTIVLVSFCVCHLVTLLLQCWWVPLVTVCGSV